MKNSRIILIVLLLGLLFCIPQNSNSQTTTVEDYFPINTGAKWEYRVDFPGQVSVPYKPWFEEPSFLLCTTLTCGMGSWEAGQINFDMLVNNVFEESPTSTTWDLLVSNMFVQFYSYLTDTLITCRLRLELEGGNAKLDFLAVLPVGDPNWIIGRALARLSPEDLTEKFNISVPAGDFTNCVKSIHYLYGSGTYILSGNFPIEVFLAPDVGIVKVVGKDLSGETLYTQELVNFIPSPAVDVEKRTDLSPKDFVLYQNYPNPFNPSTTIKYSIPNVVKMTRRVIFTKLIVYDVLGKKVATLVNREQKPGYYEVEFNAANISSGVYYYQLRAGSFIETKKMILMR